MTIAQCLRRIAKLKGEYKERLDRAMASNLFDAEVTPAFPFDVMYAEAEERRDELTRLETALRIANATKFITVGDHTMTITEATVRLQEHKARIAWLRSLNCAQMERMTTKNQQFTPQGMVTQEKVIVCPMHEARRAQAIVLEQTAFDALNDAVETMNHRSDVQL